MPGRPSSTQLLLLSLGLHIVLLVYADHVDSHPESYGGLKYTDVDWRVVSDGANLIFSPGKGQIARGWLVETLGLRIGDPYHRATFRYTPLLPLLLWPTVIHPLLGKLVLVPVSLAIPPLLLWSPQTTKSRRDEVVDGTASFWTTHLLWTLNPFVLNITTRGSPEAVIALLVVATIASLRTADAAAPAQIIAAKAKSASRYRSCAKWESRAAVLYALSISYKIYPIICAPAIWVSLAGRHGWLGSGVWRFGLVTLTGLVAVNGLLWSIWGQPFLEHTFLYHLTRLDHRHNFSPYFYPVYLSLFTKSTSSSILAAILQHPLISFLPQFGIVLLAGLILARKTDLVFAMFVQTAAFVTFNKYFMWFLPLLPPVVPHLRLTRRKAVTLVGAWVLGQATWLGTAYQLELRARSVYLPLWVAGIGYVGISVWVLGELIEAWGPVAFRLVKIE